MAGVLYRPPNPLHVTAGLPAYSAPLGVEATAQFLSDATWVIVRHAGAANASAVLSPKVIGSQIIESAGVPRPRALPPPTWITAGLLSWVAPRSRFVTAQLRAIGAPSVAIDQAPDQVLAPFSIAPMEALGEPTVLNFHQFIQAEGAFIDGIGPKTPGASRVSAQFLPYDFPPGLRVTTRLAVSGGLYVRHSWGATDQFVAAYGFNAALFGTPWASFSLRAVAPLGQSDTALGLHSIKNVSEGLRPSGIFSRVQFGNASLQNFVRFISPPGAHASQYGTGRVYNLKQFIGQAGAIGPRLGWGRPTAFNRNQFVSPKGQTHSAVGAPTAQHGIRYLAPPSVAARSAPSDKAWVSFRTRTITLSGVAAPNLGAPAVGGTRYIFPAGYEATRWGSRIIPESQTVFPLGFAGAFGQPEAWLYLKRVSPAWILSESWGQHYAWNLRQVVDVPVDHQGDLAAEKWSIWTKIENRNKVVQHHSTSPAELPRPTIANRARLLSPSSIAAPTWPANYKAGSVTYAKRYFPMDGIDPPYMGRWHAVHNGAALFVVQGFDAARYGTDVLLTNTRRYFPWISGGEMAQYGTPFIADGVRGVKVEERHAIAPPLVPQAVVHLHTRYVEPAGYEPARVGWASLEIHWTKATPRWTHIDYLGIAEVRNLTPELRTRGRNSEEFGTPAVRTQWRHVFTLENYSSFAGRPVVGFRDRRLPAEGWRSTAFGRHTVIRIGEDPPHTRKVSPITTYSQSMLFGTPSLNYRFSYAEGWDSATLPSATTVNLMGVQPEGIKPRSFWLNFGMAQVGRLADTYLTDVGAIPPRNGYGRPDFAHRTIWVGDPPDQAVANHPTTERYEAACEGIVLGRPTVSKSPQYIGRTRDGGFLLSMGGTGGDDHLLSGEHGNVALKRHYIIPSGWRSYISGYHVAYGGNRTLRCAPGADGGIVERPRIAHVVDSTPVTRTVKPAAFSGSAGHPMVEHFHRQVFPGGFRAQQMGSSRGGDTLYYPQTLHVGPRRPVEALGFNAGRFGTSWVSFRVRDLFVEGLGEELQMGYDPMNFEGRMRVRNAVADPSIPDPPPLAITPQGIDLGAVSLCDVRPGVHFIRPDGNAEQYRKNSMEIAFS